MNTVYYVIKQEPCPACQGYGMITHPRWSELHQRPDYLNLSMEQIENWFRGEGYDYPPDEEIPCPECDGAGFIRREVEISEVLQFIEDRLENLESALLPDPAYSEYNEQAGLPFYTLTSKGLREYNHIREQAGLPPLKLEA